MTRELDNLEAFLEGIYNSRIQDDDDLVLLVVGNEGAGKSTVMLLATLLWQRIKGHKPDVESVLDRIVFGAREDYKEKLMTSQSGSAIAVQDAPHVLFAKDAMVGDQKEIEKAMFDIRIENYLVMLGFQSWDVIPADLKERRAGAAIRVYRRDGDRGYLDIFGRRELDEKIDDHDRHSWPDAAAEDRFPSLEGTELWDAFNEADAAAKRERLEASKQISEEDARKQEQIKIALRMATPWRHERLVRVKNIARFIDYSESWVYERMEEWENGAYRDLVGEDDVVKRVTEEASAD